MYSDGTVVQPFVTSLKKQEKDEVGATGDEKVMTTLKSFRIVIRFYQNFFF